MRDYDDPRPMPDPAMPNHFGALVAVTHYAETGDVGPLVAELAAGRDIPGPLAAMIADALRARLLLPRPAGRRDRHFPAVDVAMAAAYARELAKLQSSGRHPLRTDRSNRDKAARAVLALEPFRRLADEWALAPSYVFRAVTNAKRNAQKSI